MQPTATIAFLYEHRYNINKIAYLDLSFGPGYLLESGSYDSSFTVALDFKIGFRLF